MKLNKRLALVMLCFLLVSTLLLSSCNFGGIEISISTKGTTSEDTNPTETTPAESNPTNDDLYPLEMQTVFEMARAAGYTGTLEELIAMFRGEPGPAGKDGVTPHIGTNGNWWVGNTDLGVPAQGIQGPQGEPGRGIAKMELVNGELIVYYTDGTVENLGPVISENPDNPDIPDIPDIPDVPDIPDIPDTPDNPSGNKKAEYNTTTVMLPTNWNALNFENNNDLQIIKYINSALFEYDYKFEDGKKFNEDGTLNVDAIIPRAYTTHYSAAIKLEDVTSLVDAKWGYLASQIEEGGYAWKITLRDDLMWEDGTPIIAADFVYSMQAQLDPAFMNFRGSEYYETLGIKNARSYFFQNQEEIFESVASYGYASNQAALDAGEILYLNLKNLDNELLGWGITTTDFVDENGDALPQYLAYNDTRVFNTPDGWRTGNEDSLFRASDIWQLIAPGGPYADYCEPGGGYDWVTLYRQVNIRNFDWEDVGIYAIYEENAIVLCLDKSFEFLTEEGHPSNLAVQYLADLPLVKKELYEANKNAPVGGSPTWTTTYNTSIQSSASWGPYMLVRFEPGSDYRLELNPYWYGWNMAEYANQYNVTAINCMKVAESTTRWLGFLAGMFDDAEVDTYNVSNDYFQSKYINYVVGTGTFGMQLYSNLDVLRESNNNNGILAIQEFRHAFNLSLNRSDIVQKFWPDSSAPCFGLFSSAYYHNAECVLDFSQSGVYRDTVEAKEALLRAYGYTQAEDGTWGIGEWSGLTLDEAHESFTGYHSALAEEKMREAINILFADPGYYGYDASKPITIVFGASVDNSKQRERAAYLQDILDELTKGTALDGQIIVEFDASAGSGWADAIRNGETQIFFGCGFSGDALDPFSLIGAFVDPENDLNYHPYWDTSKINMTMTLPAGDYEAAGRTVTMSVLNWYFCLNGVAIEKEAARTYDWSEGKAPVEARLAILAALEEIVLKENRSVMLISDVSGHFLGAKFSYITEEYNRFMEFGGMRYIVVNYTDEEWAEFTEAHNNDLGDLYMQSK